MADDDEPPPMDGVSADAAADAAADSTPDEPPPFSEDVFNDWKDMQKGLRERRTLAPRLSRQTDDSRDVDDSDDDDFMEEKRPLCSGRCLMYLVTFLVALAIVGGYQLWMWLNPQPVGCSLELVRPQKFKVDVSDFFSPRVSAALQLVLKVQNGNMLRSMLMEDCKVTVFEEATGLKLGSVHQKSLVLAPFSSTQVTVSLNALGGSLPPPEQRRLAGIFLAEKALLLTLVATATSRIPKKGTTPAQLTSNVTRRVDLSGLTKEPFFQRAYVPPAPEGGPTDAGGPQEPVDVKV